MVKDRDFQTEAANVRREFNEQRDRINADGRLNSHGKQSSIQELADAANEKIVRIRDDYFAWKEARTKEIEQLLFGLGHRESASETEKQTKITSYRAALAIAGQTESKEQLESKLAEASTFGDDLMKKAVAYYADQRGYTDLTAQALDHLYDDELAELAKLRDVSVQQKFAEGQAFAGVW